MKKKWLTTVVTALCLALVASLFTACGKKQVKIELSQTTLELIVGGGATLVATTSNGKDVEWSTSDANVATVSSRGGVTAQGAGTCTITAKYGKATATCAVTVKEKIVVSFTFTDGSGATLTEATVERDGTLQLNATASDDSEITSWESQDESIATVSPTGLVSGLFDGDTNIVVKTATGQGVIKVTVVDNFQGEKYALETDQTKGKWWYHINTEANRTHELTHAEYRGGVVRFGFSGNCNWTAGDVQLGWRNATITEGWHTLKAKISSDTEMNVSINGTTVTLVEGDNDIEVAYEQVKNGDSINIAYDALINACELVISEVAWSDFTPVDLATPTFTRNGNDITISTTDTKGIAKYQIGLFRAGETEDVFTQDLATASGKLDTSSCEQDGTFIIRVRVVGNVGYRTSSWSTDNSETVTVSNGGLSYNIEAGGESSAAKSGVWEYWTEGAVTEATYDKGTVSISSTNIGNNWYGTQLFYHNSKFATNDYIKLTMKVKATHAGSITVRGKGFLLAANTERTIEVYTQQPAVGNTTYSIQLAVENGGKDFPRFDLSDGSTLTVTFSDITAEKFVPEKLGTPSFDINGKIITITDEANSGKEEFGYELTFYDAANKEAGTIKVESGKEIDDRKIKDGAYTVKIRAVSSTLRYISSDLTEGVSYTVAHGEIEYKTIEAVYSSDKFADSSEDYAKNNQDTWVHWHVAGYWEGCGSMVMPYTSAIDPENKSITVTYGGGDVDFSVQLFYSSSELTVGDKYKLSLTVNTTLATAVKINGEVKKLVAGENKIDLEITATLTSFAFQIYGADHTDGAGAENTVTVSNVSWTEIPAEA